MYDRERKIKYEVLSHRADSGFLVKAPSMQRLYIDAALALTDIMVSLDLLGDADKVVVDIKGADRERLMVTWLNEILFLLETKQFLAKRIVFEKFDGLSIKATLWGCKYDPVKHGHVYEIKAITYHQLKFGDTDKPEVEFFVRVFMDL